MEERWPQIVVVTGRDELETLEEALFDTGALSVTEEDAGDHPILEPAPGTTPLWERTRLRALYAVDADVADLCGAL
ncbi:MAG: 50S ribosomal protein L11 methyltransferase, partial [Pseudomonadota bacterium]